MIKRTNDIIKLSEIGSFFPVLVLVGPRQVGKTTLAKQYAEQNNIDYIYLDLERPSDVEKLKDAERYLSENADSLIIIDEVQRMPALFSLLRSLVDENPRPNRFILLGSASPHIVKGISETLAGRSYLLELYPFNWLEIKDAIAFEKHFFNGGFPKAALTASPKMVSLWLKGFIQTYLERDLPMLDTPATPATLGRLWRFVASQNGQLTNFTAIGNAMGLTYNTIKKYLDFMEGAFLITQLLPYIPNSTKKLVKAPKVYIRDTGILHSLLDIKDYNQLYSHIVVGSSWETYVLAQLRANLSDEYVFYFYRTHAGAEIDLIVTKAEMAVATIEIKFSMSPSLTKGYYSALEDIGVAKNYVIVPGNADYPIKDNARVVGIVTFLEKYLAEF
ncbi:MAG: ATP-binding protein [Cytophagales bacterium]